MENKQTRRMMDDGVLELCYDMMYGVFWDWGARRVRGHAMGWVWEGERNGMVACVMMHELECFFFLSFFEAGWCWG